MLRSGDTVHYPMQGNPSEARRARSGCTVCRARKVKCDEKWPTCSKCDRLKLNCPGPPSPSPNARPKYRRPRNRRNTEFTQAGTLRRRVANSCQACRSAKTKCSGESVCVRCAAKGFDCVMNISRQSGDEQSKTSRPPSRRRQSADVEPSQRFLMQNPAVSLFPSGYDSMTSSLAWLYSPELPNGENLRVLVEEYFSHIHPLRCNGFVHKPSFMRRLDEDLDSCRQESLLHIICALGAKFFALNYTSLLSPEAILTAGNQWAKIAKARIFVDMDDLSVEKLMTAILLYDHDLRIGSYASAFMLSGMTARMSQALQLNLENSADVLCQKSDSSAITNETRRRLMWSCYLLDSWVGSGVNQLTLLEDRDLKIQLPCHSQNFSLGILCLTETLDEGETLSFVPRDQVPPGPCENMGIEAYFIRLVSIRKKVLRYVKHLDTARPPWQADSEFQLLSAQFEKTRRSLPKSLFWNSGAIYARKESSQLGALTLLWCTFHQTLVDLYRIGMPSLFRIQKEVNFPSDQQEFLQHCRRVCYDNACEVSRIIFEALRYGLKFLADSWICIIAHDSTKVMLHYLKLSGMPADTDQREMSDTLTLVQSNLDALLQMRSMVATAEHCSVSVVKMMAAAGIQPSISLNAPTNDPAPETEDVAPSEPPAHSSPENVLNPLAIYRMARTALHEKESQSSTSYSPSTQKAASPSFTVNSQPRSRPEVENLVQTYRHSGEQMQGNSPEINVSPGKSFYIPPNQSREDPSLALNTLSSPSGPGIGGAWDPSDLAFMDMLDGGITPWTADYLTDGQSGVDPFLFPF